MTSTSSISQASGVIGGAGVFLGPPAFQENTLSTKLPSGQVPLFLVLFVIPGYLLDICQCCRLSVVNVETRAQGKGLGSFSQQREDRYTCHR